jgi:PPOX class probable F420-dependent enzyme
MPSTPLPDRVRDFLRLPNPAVMATVAKDGRPVSVATWYLLEDDGRILLGLDAGRARLRHLRNDPRVSLTALSEASWYTQASVQGRVSEILDDVALAQIDRLSMHYGGQPYADRTSPRVYTHLTIERWHGWGELKDA